MRSALRKGATFRPRRRGEERGASAVEFALIVPVLLLVVFGVINFGILMAQKASLSNATRVGARYATVNAYTATTHTCASVIDRVRNAAPTFGIANTTAAKQAIAVTVKLTKASDGTTAPVCAANAGVASSGSTLPCANATGSPDTPDTLTIDATYTSKFLVSVPGIGSGLTLGSSSSFQCEYYK